MGPSMAAQIRLVRTLRTEQITKGAYRDGCAELSTLCELTTGSRAYDPSIGGGQWVNTRRRSEVPESAHESVSENERLRWRRHSGAGRSLDGEPCGLQGTR